VEIKKGEGVGTNYIMTNFIFEQANPVTGLGGSMNTIFTVTESNKTRERHAVFWTDEMCL
jgi:hypothetical protein